MTDFLEYRMRMRAGVARPVAPSYYVAGLVYRSFGGAALPSPAAAIRAAEPTAVVHEPAVSWDGSVESFHDLVARAASCSVCVAVLPDQEAVVAAAAELVLARRAGRTVVAVTTVDDFLVSAFASVVVPDFAGLTSWLRVDDLAA